MVAKKNLFIIIVLSLLISNITPQETNDDTYTAINVMITQVFYTRMGMILEYYRDGKFRRVYLPENFFVKRMVVKVNEDNLSIAPQMNIIYKNQEPYKIKLYLPTYPEGLTYQAIDVMPDDMIEKFRNTTKLVIELIDQE